MSIRKQCKRAASKILEDFYTRVQHAVRHMRTATDKCATNVLSMVSGEQQTE